MRNPLLAHCSRAVVRLSVAVVLLAGTLGQAGTSAVAAPSLRVTNSTPGAGAVDVPTTSFVSLTFDHTMVALGDVGVAGAHAPATISPATSGQGRWVNTNIWSYQLPAGLAPATRYHVATARNLAALDGSTLAVPYAFSFDTLRPNVQTTAPVNNTLHVRPVDSVQVVFNEPVRPATAEAAFLLRVNGHAVTGRFSWNGPLLATQSNGSTAAVPASDSGAPAPAKNTVMTFHPTKAFPLGAKVDASVGSGVRSLGGPLPMASAVRWHFGVTGSLVVTGSTPVSGETNVNTANGITVQLSAPADQNRMQKAIHISPTVDYSYVYLDDSGTKVTINGDFLPSTRYIVSIARGAIGTARQSLSSPYDLAFTTQQASPSVSLVSQGPGAMYNAYIGARVYARAVNVPSFTLNLYRLTASEFQRLLANPPSRWDGSAPNGAPMLATWQIGSQAAPNKSLLVSQSLTANGAPVPPGYYLVNAWTELNGAVPADHLLILVTRTSATFKVGQNQVFVWATDLKSGKPVAGESVRVIDSNTSRVWASGVTNHDGIFQQTVRSVAGTDSLLQHSMMAQLSDGSDVSACSLDWNSGIGPWDYQLPFSSYLQPIRVQLTTERPIYRPGQTVYFKGIARLDADGRYSMPAAGTSATVTIQDPRQGTVYQQRLPLDSFGGFSGKLALSPAASTGYFDLSAKIGVSSADVSFQVAAYAKPNYAVTVISDRGENANYTQGEKVGVQVRAHYYFGAPLSNAPVTWDLTENDFTFSSVQFPDYSFGDNDYVDLMNYQGSNGQEVTQGSGKTDSHGDFHFVVPANIKATSRSQQFTLEAILTGPDNQQVAQSTQVVVHKSSVYIGLKPAGYLQIAGKPNVIGVISVSDDDKHVAAGTPVTLKLYKRVWLSSFVRDSSGNYYWQDSHKDTLVRVSSLHTNGQGKADALITPADGGEYIVEAIASDPAGRTSSSKLSLWVLGTGETYVPWQPQNNDRIRLVADKQNYKPGDVAHILVTAPLAGMTALVTVERGTVLSHMLLTLPSNSSTISLPITGLYAPNIFVSVTLVKGPGKDTSIPVWRMGYVALPVDVSAHTLHVTVHASASKAAPGQRVTFTVHTADSQGRPVQAQLAVSLVDKAVLALAASQNTSLMDTYYSQRDLGVESAATLNLYIDRLNLNQTVGSKGGSGGGGGPAGPTRVKFPDTAYWNPSLVTNAAGNASITVTLPDNLTTWTFSAAGGTQSTLVGESTMDLISTKDLLLEAALPRFLTVGDSTMGGAVVDNLTGSTQKVAVTLHASGSSSGTDLHAAVSVPAGGSQLVQWPIAASAIGPRTFLISAQAESSAGLGDRLQVTVPVHANSIPVTAATSGLFRTSVNQRVVVPADAVPGEGALTVTLYPTLVSSLGPATSFLAQYPYGCNEQITSQVYGLAEANRLPRSVSGVNPSLAQSLASNARVTLQTLYNDQNGDGGWGWWPEGMSDPFVSAWVVDGMLTLHSLGYPVDTKILKRGTAFLASWALKPSSSPTFNYLEASTYTYDLQSYVVYLLGRAGTPDPGLASTLFSSRQNILPFARAYLALAIAQMSGTGDPRVKALIDEIGGAAQQFDNQAHWSDKSPDWLMMEESVSATSAILDALIRLDPKNPLVVAATRWLMVQQQHQGWWGSTFSTSLSIRALVDYAVRNQPSGGPSAFSVQVDGKTIGSGSISDANRGMPRTFSVPLAALKAGGSTVTLQQRGGGGQLAYIVSLDTYQQVTKVAPVEHGIIVGRQYQAIAGSHSQAGSDVRVVLTVTAPEDLYYVQVEDPLPAGAEAVDPSLRTTSILSSLTSQTKIPAGTSDLSWYVSHAEQRDDRVALFADFLPAGTYQYSYQLHLTSAGTYHDLPTQAQLLYFPDVYGHGSGKLYTITAH